MSHDSPLATLIQLRAKLVQLRRLSVGKLLEGDALDAAGMTQFVDTCHEIQVVDQSIADEERLASDSALEHATQHPMAEKLTRVELLERETRDKQSRTDRKDG